MADTSRWRVLALSCAAAATRGILPVPTRGQQRQRSGLAHANGSVLKLRCAVLPPPPPLLLARSSAALLAGGSSEASISPSQPRRRRRPPNTSSQSPWAIMSRLLVWKSKALPGIAAPMVPTSSRFTKRRGQVASKATSLAGGTVKEVPATMTSDAFARSELLCSANCLFTALPYSTVDG